MIIKKYSWLWISIFPVYLILLFFLLPEPVSSGHHKFKNLNSDHITESVPDSILYRVILIGDAGEQSGINREPVLDAIEDLASEIPERTTVIFLGDNIYPAGLPDSNDNNFFRYAGILDAQTEVARSKANVVFVPGNHDWGQSSSDGWERIIRQTDYINDKNVSNLSLLPGYGCPGPVMVDYNNSVRIIYIDSQWFLHPHEKPDKFNSECTVTSEEQFYTELKQILDSSDDKYIIIAAHHPLITFGTHGGYFPWTAHLFPFIELNEMLWLPMPVIGSLYPLVRNLGISDQDISGSRYDSFINNMQNIISKYKNVFYTSGHEHSLQVIEAEGGNYYLVSGYGTSTHKSFLGRSDQLIFGALVPGFIQLDFYNDGNVILSVSAVNDSDKTRVSIFNMSINKHDSSKNISLTDE